MRYRGCVTRNIPRKIIILFASEDVIIGRNNHGRLPYHTGEIILFLLVLVGDVMKSTNTITNTSSSPVFFNRFTLSYS